MKSIIARDPASFDIEFCDAFGQIAKAEELDVYVEPRPNPILGMDEKPIPKDVRWAVVDPKLKQPLIVRASAELDSERIGELNPGQMVGIVEEVDLDDGTGRARVLFSPMLFASAAAANASRRVPHAQVREHSRRRARAQTRRWPRRASL